MIVVPAWLLLSVIALLLVNAYLLGRLVEGRAWGRRIAPEAERAGRAMAAAADEIERLRESEP